MYNIWIHLAIGCILAGTAAFAWRKELEDGERWAIFGIFFITVLWPAALLLEGGYWVAKKLLTRKNNE